MVEFLNLAKLATFVNVVISSAVIIVAFSLLAYTLTYNFRSSAARRYALLLTCVVITFTGDVALNRIDSTGAANLWLRFQWLGIAMLPAAYYIFSIAVLRTTNGSVFNGRWIGLLLFALSFLSAVNALFSTQIVGLLHFEPPLSYLEAGPYFWLFAGYFTLAAIMSLYNIWRARQRCLTESSRQRITYLLLGFAAPGIGIFPYLIGLSRLNEGMQSNAIIFILAMVGNILVLGFLLLISYSVAYFGVYTPDRVVRYRLIRFFARGPLVAIVVIVAIQTIPPVERVLGLPRDLVLFSTITFVIIFSQLFLSLTKRWVDQAVYREDHGEIAWLRELDRRLLTTTDLRQFLDNNLTALCEMLRVPSGFVAAIAGPDLVLEAMVGGEEVQQQVADVDDWPDVISRMIEQLRIEHAADELNSRPVRHRNFWLYPLAEPADKNGSGKLLGLLGFHAASESLNLNSDEVSVLSSIAERTSLALMDRKLQQDVFIALQRIIPSIDQIQRMRGVIPYTISANTDDGTPEYASMLLDSSPIHEPEFDAWVKDALSHYWGGPKLTGSPLQRLRIVNKMLGVADDDPTRALRLVLESAIERLKPTGKQDFSTPEWLLYNILELRFIQGRKVREIARRLAVSESDLYRKQRVAVGQVARILIEMEQDNAHERQSLPAMERSG